MTIYTSKKNLHYSHSLIRLEVLRQNPPQANYVDDHRLQKMNPEVPS